MKKLIYILLILTNCIILHSQTYDSTHNAIWDYPSYNHSHLSYASSTYSIADSNKFLQVSTSGTITLATSSSTTTWGSVTGTLSNQTDLDNALSNKAPLSHSHLQSNIVGLTDSLSAHNIRFDSKQNTISNLADTSKYVETTDIKQGAYLSDTTKFSLTTHNHKLETITGFPDTTGNTGKYLKVLAGGGFSWDTPASGSVPAGVIVMWSGSVGTIPAGWALCDGTSGTPDLRNSFIMGAGDNYDVSETGGDSVQTFTLNASATTTMVSAGTPSGTINVIVDNHGTHYHTADGTLAAAATLTASVKPGTSAGTAAANSHTHDITGNTSNENATQTHTVSTKTFTGTPLTVHSHGVTGTTTSKSIMNRYYALCYIMKQ